MKTSANYSSWNHNFSFILNKTVNLFAYKTMDFIFKLHQLYVTTYTVMVEAYVPAGLTSHTFYNFLLATVRSKMLVKCERVTYIYRECGSRSSDTPQHT